ncbi:MAG: ATP-binding cassette domain-containing protein [Tenericutes bacterium]|jgi:ABC-2 type transport system ATP-binding protein|nr:ATP-binding cassette domain-containing protein [Mycoplasmatota bacterium]
MNLEIKNLSKKFKNTFVLENINMNFESGKIYGLVGRNGSGKSVLLKIICSFYNPSSGEVLFDKVNINLMNGFPPDTRALIEKPNFISDMTGYENLELLASIQKKIGSIEILDALKKVNLHEEKDKKFREYSLGMKQKLGIAQVIMEDPKLMILDEPFNGIEEETAKELRSILKEEARKGKLIILASHIKEDIQELCDEIYRLELGKIIEHNIK